MLSFEEVCRSLEAVWKGRHDRSELSKASYNGYCERLKLIEKDFGHRILSEISRDEILDLKWLDIDFDFGGKGLIRLFKTKNGHERTEYLMPSNQRGTSSMA